jgi:HAMP domain-containing protein
MIHRGRLFRRYFTTILILVSGALIVSGAIGVYFSYQENKSGLASLQREKAVAAAARIEAFISEIERQLSFAALPQLGPPAGEQRRIEFLKLLRLAPPVTDVAYIDGKGRERLAESRLKMSVAESREDRSREPAFVNAKPDKTWYGPVTFRKETEPYMQIAVRAGNAVTVADVNLKFIWDVITRIKVGEKGKAYVIDATGHLVADPDIGLVLRKTDLSALEHVKASLDETPEDEPAMLALDRAGNEVLTAFAPIEPLGWRVFVEQPVTEVYATLDASILRTALLLLAGFVISALAALALARSMVRPIRTLQEGAQKIGAGELEQRIDVRTGDELEALAGQCSSPSPTATSRSSSPTCRTSCARR